MTYLLFFFKMKICCNLKYFVENLIGGESNLVTSYDHLFEDENGLLNFIHKQNLANYKSLFIEVTKPGDNVIDSASCIEILLKSLPHAVISEKNIEEDLSNNPLSKVSIRFTVFNVEKPENDYKHSLITPNTDEFARLFSHVNNEYGKVSTVLNATNDYYTSIYQKFPEVAFTTDIEGRFTSINDAFSTAFGMNIDDVKGKSVEYFLPNNNVPIRRHFFRALRGKTVEFEIDVKNKSGNIEHYLFHLVPILLKDEVVEMFVFGRNITKQKVMEQKMERFAYFDQDTGLPNRMRFNEILERCVVKAKKINAKFHVMFMDVDRFKSINDMLGHRAGDMVLKELAKRISAEIPKNAVLGRFSGDKFSIILPEKNPILDTTEIGKALLKSIQKPFLYDNQEFFVTGSIGISQFPNDGHNTMELMKNADLALNYVKQQGGNSLIFYTEDMNKETVRRLEIEGSLRKALEKDELYIAYQPIINTQSRELSTCEALLRWNHPELGLIPPTTFIPIAEETGMIHEIGYWVLKKACKQIKEWQNDGMPHLCVSVNVSAHQLQNNRFIDEVKSALEYSGLEARYLYLELTESAMLKYASDTIEMMRKLGELGVNISIDDFGTGYSSLSYLKNLPIHHLKIDRSFIQCFRMDSPDFAIVNAIMTMGHGLGLNIVAEGVETKDQLTLLTKIGCDFVQGYYVEKPM